MCLCTELIRYIWSDLKIKFKIYQNRKNKKVAKEKRKLKEKINLKMEMPNDTHDIVGDNEIFSLAKIRTKKVKLFLIQIRSI